MTTDGDNAMIIGTIVTRFLVDGTIIPGDGCDTAPASVAIELSRKIGETRSLLDGEMARGLHKIAGDK